MRLKIGNIFFNLSGWLIMAAMVVAVWLRGCVWPPYISIILWWLLIACAFWGASLVLLKVPPKITPVTWIGGALLVQGWIMTLNPVSHYEAIPHLFLTLEHESALPGTVDAYSSQLGMYSFTVLFLVFHVILDCWRNEGFRQQVMWTAAISTAAVALLGILQKLVLHNVAQAQVMTGGLVPKDQSEFGPYSYHANAAALLLGCLPVAASLAVGAWVLRKRGIAIVGSVLTILIVAGLFANTARSGVALLIFLMIGLALAYWKMIGGVLPGTWFARIMTIAGILVVVVAGIAVSALVMPSKWNAVASQLTLENPRLLQWKIVSGMSLDSGFFGFGPNTFAIEFPVSQLPGAPHFDGRLNANYIFTWHTPGEQVDVWSHAHSDPMQALIEYGYVGLALWVTMAIWTVAAAIKQFYIPAPLQVKFALVAAFAGWLAVMVYSLFDFPLQVLSLQIYVVVLAGIIWSERLTEVERVSADKAFGIEMMRAGRWVADIAMQKLPAILLAAGLSSRMGALKPLLRLGEFSLLEHGVRALTQSGGISEIVLVTGHRADEIAAAAGSMPGVRLVFNANFAQGEMLSSVQSGIAALPAGSKGFVLAFADQPAVDPHTIAALVRHFFELKPPLVIPTHGGKRGHPLLISTQLSPEIHQLSAANSLRTVVHRHLASAHFLEVADASILEDLDTPEDLARARAKYEPPAAR